MERANINEQRRYTIAEAVLLVVVLELLTLSESIKEEKERLLEVLDHLLIRRGRCVAVGRRRWVRWISLR